MLSSKQVDENRELYSMVHWLPDNSGKLALGQAQNRQGNLQRIAGTKDDSSTNVHSP